MTSRRSRRSHSKPTSEYPDSLIRALYDFHQPADHTLEEFRDVVNNLPTEDVQELRSAMVQEEVGSPHRESIMDLDGQSGFDIVDIKEHIWDEFEDRVPGEWICEKFLELLEPLLPDELAQMQSVFGLALPLHEAAQEKSPGASRTQQTPIRERSSVLDPVVRSSHIATALVVDKVRDFSHKHRFFVRASATQTSEQLAHYLVDVLQYAKGLGLEERIALKCMETAGSDHEVILEWLSMQTNTRLNSGHAIAKTDRRRSDTIPVASTNHKRKRGHEDEEEDESFSEKKRETEDHSRTSSDDYYEVNQLVNQLAAVDGRGPRPTQNEVGPQAESSRKQRKMNKRSIEESSADTNETDQVARISALDQDKLIPSQPSGLVSGKRKRRRERRRSKLQLNGDVAKDVNGAPPDPNSAVTTTDNVQPLEILSCSTNAPTQQATPEPVAHMLGTKAGTSPELTAAMKVVTAGEATDEQFEHLKRNIDRIREVDPSTGSKHLEALYQGRAALSQPSKKGSSRKRKRRSQRSVIPSPAPADKHTAAGRQSPVIKPSSAEKGFHNPMIRQA